MLLPLLSTLFLGVVVAQHEPTTETDGDDMYFGVPLGSLSYKRWNTTGEVFAADEHTIVFNHFFHNPAQRGCVAVIVGPARRKDQGRIVTNGVLLPYSQPNFAWEDHTMLRRLRAKRDTIWPVEFAHLEMGEGEQVHAEPEQEGVHVEIVERIDGEATTVDGASELPESATPPLVILRKSSHAKISGSVHDGVIMLDKPKVHGSVKDGKIVIEDEEGNVKNDEEEEKKKKKSKKDSSSSSSNDSDDSSSMSSEEKKGKISRGPGLVFVDPEDLEKRKKMRVHPKQLLQQSRTRRPVTKQRLSDTADGVFDSEQAEKQSMKDVNEEEPAEPPVKKDKEPSTDFDKDSEVVTELPEELSQEQLDKMQEELIEKLASFSETDVVDSSNAPTAPTEQPEETAEDKKQQTAAPPSQKPPSHEKFEAEEKNQFEKSNDEAPESVHNEEVHEAPRQEDAVIEQNIDAFSASEAIADRKPVKKVTGKARVVSTKRVTAKPRTKPTRKTTRTKPKTTTEAHEEEEELEEITVFTSSHKPIKTVENRFSLPKTENEAAAFLLTNGATLKDYRWIGLYNQCTKEAIPLVSLDGLDPPREEIVSSIQGNGRNISSGNIRILNCNTLLIPDFVFDETSEEPSSFFYVGVGGFPHKIELQRRARVLGFDSGNPIEKHEGSDLMVRLPTGMRTFDIDFLTVFNEATKEYYGFVSLPSVLVPPCTDHSQ